MKRNVHYIAVLLMILLIAVISLANMQEVTVNLLLINFRLPLILLILVLLLLGALMTMLVNGLKGMKEKDKQEVAKSEPETIEG